MKLEVTVNVFFRDDPSILSRLDQIISLVNKQGAKMDAELQTLRDQVAQNTALEESAVTLITGLAAQITALKDDPAALTELANSLHTSAGDLSAAIAANTPAAPQPPSAATV